MSSLSAGPGEHDGLPADLGSLPDAAEAAHWQDDRDGAAL